MKIGAHMFITGGLHKAIEHGEELACETIQIFTKSNRSWNAKPLTEENIALFLTKCKETSISPIFTHNTYLINLCTTDSEKFQKSFDGMKMELDRAEQLQLPFTVLHPGSHLGAGEEKGLYKIAETLRKLFSETEGYKVKVLLETTAGQGTNLGYKFEHLATLLKLIDYPDRTGTCFDTCHAFTAGYDFRTEKGYEAVISSFDSIVGLDSLLVFHLNDSKSDCGSRVDRHEHIGNGVIGTEGFKNFLNDKRFKDHPGVLETPKGKDYAEDKDNLKVLRSLIEI
ncbi:MAG: deoxyribonuclease IV [Candidatus Helarchaeota archaeon]|nr:deoxyribonuclease IV [Candidatus Helarchaeota archaeon]